MSTLNIDLRPQSFEEVIGNANIVQSIKKQLDSGNIPVAICLSGPTGIGKTTLAYIIAKYVQGKDFGYGDNKSLTTPEIYEVNASDDNGVDAARALVAKTEYAPLVGKYRVIILDEAQKLTEPAQNVLLKALEKPNSSTIWIICTTEPSKLIKPLVGRCLKFNLHALTDKEVTILINRIQKYKDEKDFKPIHLAILNADFRLPRNIVIAVEQWLSGLSPQEAVQHTEELPEFIEIARLTYKGDWGKLAPLLQKVKPSNWKEIRGIVANYFKSILLKNEEINHNSKFASTIYAQLAESIKLLTIYSYDDITGWPSTVAILYQICQKMG